MVWIGPHDQLHSTKGSGVGGIDQEVVQRHGEQTHGHRPGQRAKDGARAVFVEFIDESGGHGKDGIEGEIAQLTHKSG